MSIRLNPLNSKSGLVVGVGLLTLALAEAAAATPAGFSTTLWRALAAAWNNDVLDVALVRSIKSSLAGGAVGVVVVAAAVTTD